MLEPVPSIVATPTLYTEAGAVAGRIRHWSGASHKAAEVGDVGRRFGADVASFAAAGACVAAAARTYRLRNSEQFVRVRAGLTRCCLYPAVRISQGARRKAPRRRVSLAATTAVVHKPEVEESAESSEEDDEMQVRPRMDIERLLPEDHLFRKWEENPPVPVLRAPRTIRPKGKLNRRLEEEKIEKMRARNPWSAYHGVAAESKELIAKFSVSEAREKARQHQEESKRKHLIGDDIGTGEASPSAYVEISARWDGPEVEASNSLIAEHLGISYEKASRLVELGSVWRYDSHEHKDWIRLFKNEKIDSDAVLRVFPNPQRYKTCYVDDWEERVKKVDRDFVVVDKPPLLPCFANVSNGRETLHKCLAEALRIRQWMGSLHHGNVDTDLMPVTSVDEEVSGLIILARHDKARIVFDEWLIENKCIFEFAAICIKDVPVGIYRHFMKRGKSAWVDGQPLPALYEEIPEDQIKNRSDYDDWQCIEMEVVATAPLLGGKAAVRLRTKQTGSQERIRAQLAMLGAPVLNDRSAMEGFAVPEEVARNAGMIPSRNSEPESLELVPGEEASSPTLTALVSGASLGGAVDEETLRGPYGHKMQLLKGAKDAAERGVSQKPRKKVPVALHLARVEFLGRVVTCAPPPYWPEGAAAAVAVKLTAKDIETQIREFLISQGGWARIGNVGGSFGVKMDWVEERFPVKRARNLVFASEQAVTVWEAQLRVKTGHKAWLMVPHVKSEKHKKLMDEVREKYVHPKDRGHQRTPRYHEIKKRKVKPWDPSAHPGTHV
eukprot:TRINITY_DN89624_c0_g1_i1.p1 TRINITY_DN89624_c0_g1~~TRINITY_DN89624_c0_g1_i1.p1  ORF type:complete len:780 (-),score=136.86 TRINITY_DN89624_c0_g1_i1:25-2364(-)